jgi:cytochrome c-type biogenesis protein
MSGVNFGLAFLAGLLSFLSPCVLPLAPGYLAILSGASLEELRSGPKGKGRLFIITAAFVAGFTLVFILLGLASSFLGQLLLSYRGWLARIGGLIVILLGLHVGGWLRIPWLYREHRADISRGGVGPGGAFLAGLVFSLGWTPCIGPILGAILTLAASQADIGAGALLLAGYSLGMAIPFFILAAAFGAISRWLGRVKSYFTVLEWIAGALLILVGFLLVTNNLDVLSQWLMRLTGGWSPEDWLP